MAKSTCGVMAPLDTGLILQGVQYHSYPKDEFRDFLQAAKWFSIQACEICDKEA